MFPFTAIDFETTGTVPGFVNEPWQIGAVAFGADGAPDAARSLDSLLRIAPDRPFNRYAPGRHASLRAELAAAPTPAEFWPDVARLVKGAPLAAHNAGTERTTLARIAPLHVPGPWIDTLALARRAWPGRASYALEDLIPELGLTARVEAAAPGRAPHDAYYDAVACGVLLVHLLSFPGWGSASPEALSAIK